MLSNPFKIERQLEVLSEALKADVNEIIGYMYLDDLLIKVRNQECIPSERKKGLLVELAKKDDISICENWEVNTLFTKASSESYDIEQDKNA